MFFFFPLRSLKGSRFIHLALQSGPKWPMTRYRVHCTLCGERGSDGEPKNRTRDEVGGLNYVLWPSDRHKPPQPVRCSSSKRRPPPKKNQPRLIIGIICTTCVFDFIRKQPPFSGNVCLFSWHMHSYLIGIAFQRLSICFATKMHLYFLSACNIPNSEPARILSIRVRLDAYINTVMFKAFTFSFLSFVNKGLATTQLLYMTR